MRSVIQYSSTLKIIINLAALCAIILSTGLAISYGSTEIELGTVWEAVFQFDPELSSHQIIQELRLPRALSAALVGAFLAVSGSMLGHFSPFRAR